MNFLAFGYGAFAVLFLSVFTDFSDSVVIGTAILFGCFMISENLVDIKDEISKEVKKI